jgi:hypothetical protein
MQTACTIEGERACFLVRDVDMPHHQAVRDLGFEVVDSDFVRCFPAKSPHLDRIYATFARHIEDLILQLVGARPVPWESALEGFLRIVVGQGIDWYLVGSGALAVRGLRVIPRDLDVVVDNAGASRLGNLLLDYLVEPVSPAHDWFCNWFGRAFIGARVEWVGGVDQRGDTPLVTDFGPTAASRRETVGWRGYKIGVPPLDLQREVSKRRGLTERVREIDRMLHV